jgi:tripartite-type tricarboxylate transporter receptor subunit TctC
MKFPRGEAQHLVASAAAVGVLFTHLAWSQTPRAIKIVVPSAPGAADFLACVLAEQVGRVQGLTAVVENRPGAGTVVGAEAISRAPADGSTLLFNSKESTISPHLRKVN